MWTGLQFGALGTFVFVSFYEEGFPYRLVLVFICWIVGFCSACYGLLQYQRRRTALLDDDPDPTRWESPRAPFVLVALFFMVVLSVLTYAIVTRQHHTFAQRAGGVAPAATPVRVASSSLPPPA